MSAPFLMAVGLLVLGATPAQVTRHGDWVGDWHYEVKWPGHRIVYGLRVFQEDGRLMAEMANDGHMTLDRMRLRVELQGDTARFHFLRHVGEHLQDLWTEGELLFEMRKTRRGVVTRWRTFATEGEPEGEAVRFRRRPARTR